MQMFDYRSIFCSHVLSKEMNTKTITPTVDHSQNLASAIPTPELKSQNIPMVTRHSLRNSTNKQASLCMLPSVLTCTNEIFGMSYQYSFFPSLLIGNVYGILPSLQMIRFVLLCTLFNL